MQEGTRGRLPLPALILSFIVVAIFAGAASGAVVALLLDSGDNGPSPSGAAAANPTAVVAAAGNTVPGLVQNVLPSVVTIIDEPQTSDQSNTVLAAVGSGFIVDARGYIVTNEHVVHNPGALIVVLSDGEERPAELVSADAPFTDLAVIRIQPGGLQALSFGDSDRLQLGQQVVAIGTPLGTGFQNSVTVGVVSGLQRFWLRQGVYMEDLIQTDAPLNSGNSGGPLITMDGKVVGINSLVIHSSQPLDTVESQAPLEPVNDMGLAISSRVMQPIIASIIASGEYPRPYFGIDHENIDPSLVQSEGLAVSQGALVTNVTPGSPADKAGIETGDVLLRIGHTDITSDVPFINALAEQAPDQPVDVRVWRNGNVMTTTVDLQPR